MEDLKVINQRLADTYGYFESSHPMWKLVFADDEVEKRIMTHDKHGHELLIPEVKEVKKYKQWISGKFVLERIIPVYGQTDLVTSLSYEPVFVFQDADRNFLPYRWDVIEIVIYGIYEAAANAMKATMADRAIYKHPLAGLNTEQLIEQKRAEIEEMKAYFFGNETDIGDALAYRSGVSMYPDAKEIRH